MCWFFVTRKSPLTPLLQRGKISFLRFPPLKKGDKRGIFPRSKHDAAVPMPHNLIAGRMLSDHSCETHSR